MNKTEQKLIDRINQLVDKAEKLKAAKRPDELVSSIFVVDYAGFQEWNASMENIIIKIAGIESPYYINYKHVVQDVYLSCVEAGIGIILALKEDIEQGFLTSVQELVKAEVFTDFLEIAEHLLDNNYKDPAASLIGAVLENGLKDIAAKNSITVSKRAGIDEINKKLASNSVYNALVQKQVDVWRVIRNSADHGNFSDYTLDDVKNMKSGVENFLANHL
jgi:hypothetical protein